MYKSDKIFKTFLNNLSDAAYATDNQGNITYTNKVAEKITGIPLEDLIGKPFLPLFTEESQKVAVDVYQRTLNGESPEYELTFIGGRIGHFKNKPLRDEDGKIICVFGIARDITDRKMYEEKLKKELEIRVEERTAKLKTAYEQLLKEINERKRVEEALRDSEQEYRDLYDNAPDMYHTLDKNGIIIECNETEARILGYKKEKIIGKPVTDFFTEESKRLFQKDFPRLNEENKLLNIEREFVRKDGTIFPAILNVFSEYDEKGNFIKARTISRDVTVLKQADTALRTSEKKYRDLIDNSLVGIYKTDLKGNILYVNKAVIEILEFDSLNDLISINVLETYKNSHDREELIKKLIEKGRVRNLELELVTKTGKYKNIILNAFLDKDIISGMIMDITERKLAEKVLLESEERYKRLIKSVTDYVYTVEIKDGLPVRTSHGPGCESVTGYTSEEFTTNPYLWYHMVYDEDKEAVTKQSERILARESVPPLEHRIIHKNGSVIWVRNSIVPRHDDKGNLISYDGLISNITERKRLEEQLLHAQKMEAIGQLAGGIAHDFNNILTAIIGFGTLLKMETDKDDILRSYAIQILNSAEKAANLTHALLAFSRKQIISPKPVNLNEIIREVENLLSRIIEEDIALYTVLTDKDLTVMADSSQIEQVLMNLATNARDAMPDGGSLTIRTERITLDNKFIRAHGYGKIGSYALISVEDIGQGMDEKTKERLFDPFFTTKEVGRGTGLGLSMVYGIIKQHNGYIDIQSELGKGATFKIYLPLTQLMAEDKKLVDPPFLKGGTETILIAEDELYVRDFLKEVLIEYGYTVIEASDGEDAIRAFNTHKEKIQLLIFDVIMPKKDGKEAYHEIKQVRPDMKVIFISGYSSDILYKKGIIEESLNFISKPIIPDELLIKVREILDK